MKVPVTFLSALLLLGTILASPAQADDAVDRGCKDRLMVRALGDQVLAEQVACLSDEYVAFAGQSSPEPEWRYGATPGSACTVLTWLTLGGLRWVAAPCHDDAQQEPMTPAPNECRALALSPAAALDLCGAAFIGLTDPDGGPAVLDAGVSTCRGGEETGAASLMDKEAGNESQGKHFDLAIEVDCHDLKPRALMAELAETVRTACGDDACSAQLHSLVAALQELVQDLPGALSPDELLDLLLRAIGDLVAFCPQPVEPGHVCGVPLPAACPTLIQQNPTRVCGAAVPPLPDANALVETLLGLAAGLVRFVEDVCETPIGSGPDDRPAVCGIPIPVPDTRTLIENLLRLAQSVIDLVVGLNPCPDQQIEADLEDPTVCGTTIPGSTVVQTVLGAVAAAEELAERTCPEPLANDGTGTFYVCGRPTANPRQIREELVAWVMGLDPCADGVEPGAGDPTVCGNALCPGLGAVPGFCDTPLPTADPCDHVPGTTLGEETGDGRAIHGPCGPIPLPGACVLVPDAPFACGPGPDPCVRETGGECYTVRGLLYSVGRTGYDADQDLDRMGDEWERRVVGTLHELTDWTLDLDQDGLRNLDEYRWDTHPLDPDTDDDGVQDGPEAEYWDRTPDQAVDAGQGVALQDADAKADADGDGLANILDADSDDDHLGDGDEYHATYSPGARTYLEFPDSDLLGSGDGLTDYQELRDRDGEPANGPDGGYGTLPMDEDSDDDSVLDGEEAARWGAEWSTEFDCSAGANNLRDADSDGDTLADGAEWERGIDPRLADSDGDGMDDAYELEKGFLPSTNADGHLDADGDGLENAYEYAFDRPAGYQVCAFGPYRHGFDPTAADMDGDSLVDGTELDGRLNPYKSGSAYAGFPGSTGARSADTDEEGLGDAQEVALGTDPNDPDTDDDRLSDQSEVAGGTTDPKDADSDDDGLDDGAELDAGVDPRNPDSDGDGEPDGSDDHPGRESIPPMYPGGAETYVVFRQDGYIDVMVEDVNSDEVTLDAVVLSGTLKARGPNGVALPPMHFNMEATRGDNGIWGARVGVPPGVESVVEETVRLLSIDQNGNAWAIVGTFDHVLDAPAWSPSPQAVKDANDWAVLIEHQSQADVAPPSGTLALQPALPTLRPGPDGTMWYDPAGPLGAVSIYRVDPGAFQPMQVVQTMFGEQTVSIAEDGFAWVDPTLEPTLYEQTAFGLKWKAPKYLFKGIQNVAKEFLDSAYHTSETALREAKYQTASFVLGSDHPAAHGRSAGDFVGGFLLWGDFRDCIVRPAYIDPETDAQKIIDAAITLLSCTGLAVDVAQVSFAAPSAVAANAAMTMIKLTLKKLVKLDAQLALHIVDLIKVCKSSLSLCLAVTGLAKLAKDDDIHRAGAKQLLKDLGSQKTTVLESTAGGITKRYASMYNDFPGWTDAQHKALIDRMHQSSTALGTSADQTFRMMVDLHHKFPAGLHPKSNIVPSAFDIIERPGGAQVIKDILNAKGAANDNKLFALMAWSQMTKEGRVLDQVEVPGTTVRLSDGRPATAKPDAYVSWPGRGKIVTEIKDGALTTNNLGQIEREMALAKQDGGSQMDAWSSFYRAGPNSGAQVDANFKEQVRLLADRYGVQLYVRDGKGVEIWNSGLP